MHCYVFFSDEFLTCKNCLAWNTRARRWVQNQQWPWRQCIVWCSWLTLKRLPIRVLWFVQWVQLAITLLTTPSVRAVLRGLFWRLPKLWIWILEYLSDRTASAEEKRRNTKVRQWLATCNTCTSPLFYMDHHAWYRIKVVV